MSEEVKIENQAMLDEFIHRADGLHDALVHEAILLHPGYVDERGWMYGDVGLPNARVIIQSQSADVIGIELNLYGVSTFNLCFDMDMRLEGEVVKDGVVLYPNGRSNACSSQIRAVEISYQILGMDARGSQFKYSCGIEAELIKKEDEPQDFPGAG